MSYAQSSSKIYISVVLLIVCLFMLQAFETPDGYIMAGAGNDKQFEVLCKVT